jgi:hypothetical protein
MASPTTAIALFPTFDGSLSSLPHYQISLQLLDTRGDNGERGDKLREVVTLNQLAAFLFSARKVRASPLTSPVHSRRSLFLPSFPHFPISPNTQAAFLVERNDKPPWCMTWQAMFKAVSPNVSRSYAGIVRHFDLEPGRSRL